MNYLAAYEKELRAVVDSYRGQTWTRARHALLVRDLKNVMHKYIVGCQYEVPPTSLNMMVSNVEMTWKLVDIDGKPTIFGQAWGDERGWEVEL